MKLNWSNFLGIPIQGEVTATYNLAVSRPELAKEWHFVKNGDVTPMDVTIGSNEKYWWECKEGHEWKAAINNRSQGKGCPYCASQLVCKGNCLATLLPNLASEWHPTKNEKLTPNDVTCNSSKRIWWICEKGHEWEAVVGRRKLGNGCPYCSGIRVTKDKSLASINPKLAKQWHPTKNGELTPFDVAKLSNVKVWWRCKKGHAWEAAVASRTNGRGCPYCSGRYASKGNCLANNSKLAREWHPTKNGSLTPFDVTSSSGKKVWWKCKKKHKWEAAINNRSGGRGCPYCDGKRVCKDNCLAIKNPKLAKQWHPTKNGELTPFDVTRSASVKVWWRCKKGHEWKSTINNRNNGRGCSACSSMR